jgi:hypothetical protein
MDSNAYIATAVVVMATTTAVAGIKAGNGVQFHPMLAALFVGIFLSFIALINDRLAQLFSVYIVIVALVRNGSQTFGLLGNPAGTEQQKHA